MSVRFDAAADRLLRTASVPSYDSNYTISFWAYFPSRPGNGAYFTVFGITDNVDDLDYIAFFGNSGSDTRLNIGTQTGGAFTETNGTTNLSPSTWYHIGLIRSANNSRIAYLNGVQETNHTTSVSARTAPTRMEFGANGSSNGDPYSGRVESIKIYEAALSVAELQQEINVRRAIRTSNLHIWSPCFPGAAERLRDYSGNGRTWTESGTLTDEDPAPVSWGASVITPGLALNATYELEGFRFRNDDGSETTATWRQAQDTDDSIALETAFRLRMLVNTTNNAPSQNYKLQYRRAGVNAWRDVP